MNYIGIVDGNNFRKLIKSLRQAKNLVPVLSYMLK
ncbi:hypothetical protein [Spiroplasma endosymbiont of Polydrusus formosus]